MVEYTMIYDLIKFYKTNDPSRWKTDPYVLFGSLASTHSKQACIVRRGGGMRCKRG